MQVINLDALHLITPMRVDTSTRLNYYAPVEIHAGDILFAEHDNGVSIYRVRTAVNTKQRRPVLISKTHKGKFLSRVYLAEVTERHAIYPEFHEKVCDALGVPF